MPRVGTYLYVDAKEFEDKFRELSSFLNEKNARTLYFRTLNETGRKAKTIIPRALRAEYAAKPPINFYKKDIGSARISRKASDVVCTIPISGLKGYNRTSFSITGRPNHGVTQKGKRQLLKIKTVRGTNEHLPYHMKRYGGQPPFLNNKYILTRVGKARYPIIRIPGLATAQMPLNRGQERVERDLEAYMMERLIHNFNYLLDQQIQNER